MAIIATVSNHAKYQLALGAINLNTGGDTLQAILMKDTFGAVFDADTHGTLDSVTSGTDYQLATSGGYTKNDEVLANQAVAEDDVNDKAAFTCDDVTFTATAGGFGPTGGWCLVDTTTADDTIICYVDFGEDYTIASGSSLQLQEIAVSLT